MKRRDFLKNTAALSSAAILPSSALSFIRQNTLRTAHIGVGEMEVEEPKSIASHFSLIDGGSTMQ